MSTRRSCSPTKSCSCPTVPMRASPKRSTTRCRNRATGSRFTTTGSITASAIISSISWSTARGCTRAADCTDPRIRRLFAPGWKARPPPPRSSTCDTEEKRNEARCRHHQSHEADETRRRDRPDRIPQDEARHQVARDREKGADIKVKEILEKGMKELALPKG